jgi:Asp-tRNA(Asn)/Glu-tRNA(Gln) amidotransferase A subunit family amidase
MVPFALGTQTGGSILRPASYCGVTGFKPTHGLFSLDGVLQYSRSCDTLGFFTNTPDDMLLLWDALGHPTGREEELSLGIPEPLPEGVEPAMATAFRAAVASLRKRRVATQAIEVAPLLSKLVEAQNVIATYEGARAHTERFKQYGDRLGQVATMVRDGLKIPEARYDEARRFVSESRTRLAEMYKSTPVMLVPAATGPAPLGLSSTGDSKMNAPWTVLGTPAISIPMPVGSNLPLGLQLTAGIGEDARVLRTAARLYPLLNGT